MGVSVRYSKDIAREWMVQTIKNINYVHGKKDGRAFVQSYDGHNLFLDEIIIDTFEERSPGNTVFGDVMTDHSELDHPRLILQLNKWLWEDSPPEKNLGLIVHEATHIKHPDHGIDFWESLLVAHRTMSRKVHSIKQLIDDPDRNKVVDVPIKGVQNHPERELTEAQERDFVRKFRELRK